MYSPEATSKTYPFINELIQLLGELPIKSNKPRAKAFTEQLSDLEARARKQGARVETLAAIKGGRVLMELAELQPLLRAGLPSKISQ